MNGARELLQDINSDIDSVDAKLDEVRCRLVLLEAMLPDKDSPDDEFITGSDRL